MILQTIRSIVHFRHQQMLCCTSSLQNRLSVLLLLTAVPLVMFPAIAQVPASPSVSPIPASTQTTADDLGKQRQAIAEQFVDLTFAGRYDAATELFDPILGAVWSPEVLQNRTAEFQQRTGKFIRRLGTRVEGNVVLIDTEFEKVTDSVVVVFEEGNEQITGLDFPAQPHPTTMQ